MRLFLYGFLCCNMVVYGQNVTVSGYISDTGREALAGVSVRVAGTALGSTSNAYGFYSITFPRRSGCLIFAYAGMTADTLCREVWPDTALYVTLQNRQLQEVSVFSNRIEDQIQMSSGTLPLDLVKKMPNLAGESDIIKALSFMPGITNGSEGSAGLFVRGGAGDQNLILLDNAIVYNPNHLFGFLSVFNADAIKNVEIIKGGFPARYGGRLSSVLDVSMKEGSREKLRGEGGIGLVASRALLEGPFRQKKGSFMVAARSAYLGVLLLPLWFSYQSSASGDYTGYYMYDVNAKANYDLSPSKKIFLNFYHGRDRLRILGKNLGQTDRNSITWGNITGAALQSGVVAQIILEKYARSLQF